MLGLLRLYIDMSWLGLYPGLSNLLFFFRPCRLAIWIVIGVFISKLLKDPLHSKLVGAFFIRTKQFIMILYHINDTFEQIPVKVIMIF